MDSPWILIPLGNPGPEYAGTRHNLGRRLLLDWLAARGITPEPLRLFKTGTLYALTPGIQALVPATYMNLSGQVCGEAAKAGLSTNRLLVLLDDKDLPLGTGRLRMQGAAHGHNGLASVQEHLGTDAVPRLRLGIGPFQRPLHEFVLGPWTPAEEELIQAMGSPFAAFLESLVTESTLERLPGQVNPESFWRPVTAS
nr:aminoacyl-tRNA hydrolase [uncultured Holophaga sp.]